MKGPTRIARAASRFVSRGTAFCQIEPFTSESARSAKFHQIPANSTKFHQPFVHFQQLTRKMRVEFFPKKYSPHSISRLINPFMKILATAAALAFCSFVGHAAHWPQFRGPSASGLAEGATLPTQWNISSSENVHWRTPIPGLAHASPIVWGDTIYIATVTTPAAAELKVGLYGDIAAANDNGPQTWRLLAVNKESGKILWNKVAHEAIPRVKRHTKATHCNSTPATDGQRIVAIFGSEGLFCFDAKGDLLWKKDLGPMDSGFFAVKSAQWGFATSPIIHDGKVIVQCDVQTNSFIALYDLKDGRELWKTERKDVPTWSTPTVTKVGDATHILVNGWHHTGAYDFASGKEIWKMDGGGDIPVPTPIVGHGLAYFTSAHGKLRPVSAIRLDEAKGDITPGTFGETNAAITWVHPRQGAYMQTPILVGEYLYSCTDSGVLTCFDARTGKIQYSERLSTSGQGFTASAVSDGRNLFFASETGNVFVVPVGAKFSILATNSLDETCMATPAISDGALLFRTRDHLVSLKSR
jgi:outer membrane protein assembly factor BamB